MIVHNSYYGAKRFENGTVHEITLTLVEDMCKFFIIKHIHTIEKTEENTNICASGASLVGSPLEAHRLFEEAIEDYCLRGYR